MAYATPVVACTPVGSTSININNQLGGTFRCRQNHTGASS